MLYTQVPLVCTLISEGLPQSCMLIRGFSPHIYTWQAGTALHSVRFFSITKTADIKAQGFDIINALRHHQVLVHQVAAVRVRLEQRPEHETVRVPF